jgi:hypothetical protein
MLKKLAAVIVLVMVASLSVVGCTSSTNNASPSPQLTPSSSSSSPSPSVYRNRRDDPYFASFVAGIWEDARNIVNKTNATLLDNETWRFSGDYMLIWGGTYWDGKYANYTSSYPPRNDTNDTNLCNKVWRSASFNRTANYSNPGFNLTVFYVVRDVKMTGRYYTSGEPAYNCYTHVYVFKYPKTRLEGKFELVDYAPLYSEGIGGGGM